LAADDPNSDEDVVGDAFAPTEPVVGPTGERVLSVAELMAQGETEGDEETEDEDEDEDEGETDEPKPAFDGKGMNMVPPTDPDDEDEGETDEPKPAFDGKGMNMVPPTDPDAP
jgi:C4-dicarboxylate transporter DctM subunit